MVSSIDFDLELLASLQSGQQHAAPLNVLMQDFHLANQRRIRMSVVSIAQRFNIKVHITQSQSVGLAAWIDPSDWDRAKKTATEYFNRKVL